MYHDHMPVDQNPDPMGRNYDRARREAKAATTRSIVTFWSIVGAVLIVYVLVKFW